MVEDLEPFFSMLKTKDREFWFREEVSCRERIGMRRISKHNFLHLVFAERNLQDRRLRSVHNYDILTNPTYSDKFHYVPCAYNDRDQYIISDFADPWLKMYSTDIVRIACDLAYMPTAQALKLEFDEVSIYKQMIGLHRLTTTNMEESIPEHTSTTFHKPFSSVNLDGS